MILATALAFWAPGDPPGAAFAASATGFVEGLNDVPLMPGLRALGDTLVFDKPGGRIAEAVFTAPAGAGAGAVRAFYARTLPQLGWRAVDGAGTHFVRDAEELDLHVGGDGGATTLRFVLRPHR